MSSGCTDTEDTASAGSGATQEPVEAPQEPAEPVENRSLPDLVGLDLQSAQDALQTAGYDHMRSIDDTGRGRNQVNDSNWVVVDQQPSAGEQVSPAYEVVMFVVKDGEQ